MIDQSGAFQKFYPAPSSTDRFNRSEWRIAFLIDGTAIECTSPPVSPAAIVRFCVKVVTVARHQMPLEFQ